MWATSSRDMKKAAPKRRMFSDKYGSGRAVVVGGSELYHGAPAIALRSAFNTLAALRIGAGYVKTYVPLSVLGSVRSVSPNMIVVPCGTNEIKFTDGLKKDIGRTDAVAIGMGIGKGTGAVNAAAKIIDYCLKLKRKVVVDAEAITAIKKMKKRLNRDVVITPHDVELSELLGIKIPKTDFGERVEIAKEASRRLGMIVVLKGHWTIITDGKRVKINKSKSAALATMGTGDVLTGIIAGYAATGASLFDAAVASVHLHSLIGDMLYRNMGDHIIATDIVENIPYFMKKSEK